MFFSRTIEGESERSSLEHSRERREGVLFADHQFLVLVRDVAPDISLQKREIENLVQFQAVKKTKQETITKQQQAN